MNVIAKISCYLLFLAQCQCRYTEIAQRIFKYSNIQYTSLTPDKILNNLVYRTLFYVNMYGSFKLSKNSPVFGPTCTLIPKWARQVGRFMIKEGSVL